ncbi:MAG TPA: efflux transporter outer membrane subunit [Alphaproteobacteria bacterium]|nr:efflux transporter outer membrane subunit [Alphaproteobacteria bacterium]
MARGHGRLLAVAALAASLAACTVGPDYVRPTVVAPAAYKEVAGWKLGQPRDAADRGPWWAVYQDAVLDGLARQVEVSNQNLKASEAAYRAAVAVVQQAQAALFPTITLNGSATRSKASGGGGGGSSAHGAPKAISLYELTLGTTWDIDVWGRIRRTIESDVANAQASAGDLASARLSAQAALATAYFQLRVEDELKDLLEDAAEGYARSLEITRNKYTAGTAARSDVAQAETQLEATQAQAINVGVQRAQLEHSIAVLIGKPPADFAIAHVKRSISEMPVVPPGMPSALLERRPDIAAAERRVAAANAQIGVAIAAYYPDLTLSASYGYLSNKLANLIQASNNLWSLGPQLAETVLDWGARSAQVDAARASYDQSVATYRQTVLAAFQQVEDELAALRILAEQAKAQAVAVQSAKEAERLIFNQYKAGTIDYTSVVTAQVAALSNEEAELTIRQNRLVASVTLIEALGGGWAASQLPAGGEVNPGPFSSGPSEAERTGQP